MDSKEKKYWVAWSNIYNIGPQKFKLLIKNFKDLLTAWQSNYQQLIYAGFNSRDAQNIIYQRNDINPNQEWKNILKHQINVVCLPEKEYPTLLKEIYAPPPILYYRGKLPESNLICLAVVGTRKTSPYGRQITPVIVNGLAKAGLSIVSGLALGIDSVAHQATIDANGITIAVLGCGLDKIYPISNITLANNIIDSGGCILSEYPPGTQPLKQHFPARNRIISGLSKGVLVIEGSHKSGSLITAKCALEQNREVYAVPGNINQPNSSGTNGLIQMGACLVTKTEDILDALNIEELNFHLENKKIITTNEFEKNILQNITDQPMHVDEIIQKCKLKTSIIISNLTIMEMKGMIRHIGGKQYILNR